MGASVALEQGPPLRVAPGEQLRTRARVGNTSTRVDALRLDVVGLPEGWARVEPPELRLLPAQHATVEVVLAPERASTSTAGSYVLGLRAQSREDPGGSAVEEAQLQVLPYTDVSAELVPRTRRARGLGVREYVLAVDNRSNVPLVVGLDAVDPDGNLALAVSRSSLDCPSGSAVFAAVRVRGQRRYWRGPVVSKAFRAELAVPGHDAPIAVPGTFEHQGLLPEALPRVAMRTALLLGGLALLFLVVLKPAQQAQQQKVADASARQAVGPVQDKADAAARQAQQAAAAAQAAQLAAKQAETLLGARPTPSAPAAPTAGGGAQPFSQRLQVSSADYAPYYRVAPDSVLTLRGFVLQPEGDRGEATLLRSGQVLVTARLGETQVFDLPAPIVFGPGSTVQLAVHCRDDVGSTCTSAVLLTGTLARVAGSPSPTPLVTVVGPTPDPYTPSPAG